VISQGLALAPAPFVVAVVPGAVLRRGSRAPRGGGIHAHRSRPCGLSPPPITS